MRGPRGFQTEARQLGGHWGWERWPGWGGEAWVHLRREPSPKAELVHGNGEVARLVATAVQVAVIHGHQVHVTEDEAVVGGVLLQRL